MRPTITKKYLTFILLVGGIFSFSVADAQFICDCVQSHPVGNCYVNDRGQTKCFKFNKNHPPFFLLPDNKETTSTPITIYHNPGPQSTTISFLLQQSQKVSISVFDMNGRLVSTLADKIFEAGENKILWKADNVSTGIYFLQFQSAENLLREKLFVTK